MKKNLERLTLEGDKLVGVDKKARKLIPVGEPTIIVRYTSFNSNQENQQEELAKIIKTRSPPNATAYVLGVSHPINGCYDERIMYPLQYYTTETL